MNYWHLFRLKVLNGSPCQSKIEHIEVFWPLIEYIREHFTDAYEFVENAYKVVVERNEGENDDE